MAPQFLDEAESRSTRRAAPGRILRGVPLAVGLGAFALYLATAARTVTWGHGGSDGPELSAAAAVLGVAHPPGYPLYLLLGHLFAQLPFGEVAFRVGLLSAVAAALGVAWAARLAGMLAAESHSPHSPLSTRHSRPSTQDSGLRAQHPALRLYLVAALATGAVLATSPLYWSQATIPEVYALHAALVLATLTLLASWSPRRDPMAVLLAFLFGLGLGNHLTLALLALPAALYVLARDPGILRRKALLLAPAAFLVGLTPYLYLPLRAAADPPLNWGDPSGWPRFLAHVTAGSYQGYWGGRPLVEAAARIPVMAQIIIAQLTWPGLVISLLGLAELARMRPALFRVLLGYLVLTLGFTLFYYAENGQIYLLPAVILLALSLGLGAAHLASLRAGMPVAIAAAILIPLWQGWVYWPAMDLSSDRAAATYARETLSQAAPCGVLLTDRDEQTFVLWYAQTVEGLRPDVIVLDRRLLAADWYRAQVERRHPNLLRSLQP